MEINELSKNARGGTELMLERLHKSLPEDLLSKFQIIPSRVRELDPNRKKILWLHDLPNDPESAKLSDESYRSQFDKIVMVSDWQMQMYNLIHGVKYSECVVLNNGIIPIEEHIKPNPEGRINIVYHTTPHRGLAILVPVIEELAKHVPNIHLHVFSSFEIYGWAERNKPYEQLFHTIKNHPNMTYYGTVSNDEIREHLKDMHIFAYPSVWPETSCLAAIEAMSAGCVVVSPNYAALAETCGKWAFSYQYTENPQDHADRFLQILYFAIESLYKNKENMQLRINAQKTFYDSFYNWNKISEQWKELLITL